MPIDLNGQNIEDITLNGNAIGEVTVNGQTVFTAIPKNLVDNFEDLLYDDQGLTFTDRWNLSNTSLNRVTTNPFTGIYNLKFVSKVSALSFNLPNTPDSGETTVFRPGLAGFGTATVSFGAFCNSTVSSDFLPDNGYVGVFRGDLSEYRLVERNQGSTVNIDSASINEDDYENQYHKAELTFDQSIPNVELIITLDGTQTASLSLTPSNDYSNVDGIWLSKGEPNGTNFMDDIVIQ